MTAKDAIRLRFLVAGADLLLPDPASPGRADGLWKSTCFELFLQPLTTFGYFEMNFSPSTQWAAYRFDSYRKGMRDMQVSVEPHIELRTDPEDNDAHHVLEVAVDLSDIPAQALRMGLSAVIEEKGGRKSWWALAHPPGGPDFHHRDCFALELPAADAS